VKIALLLSLVIFLGSLSVALTGCAKDDVGQVPTKNEIDKGLAGQPAIDPSLSANGAGAMKKNIGKK